MIDFTKCKKPVDYEKVIMSELKVRVEGSFVYVSNLPLPTVVVMVFRRHIDSFPSYVTKSGHAENCLFPGDEVETECCALCDHENEVPFRPGGYVSVCENCGKKMHLCSRCLYDNPEHGCDWNEKTNSCWRG